MTPRLAGTVRIDPMFQAREPARAGGAYVTFEPCSRIDWHTHPLGQTLIVTSGCGLHQRDLALAGLRVDPLPIAHALRER